MTTPSLLDWSLRQDAEQIFEEAGMPSVGFRRGQLEGLLIALSSADELRFAEWLDQYQDAIGHAALMTRGYKRSRRGPALPKSLYRQVSESLSESCPTLPAWARTYALQTGSHIQDLEAALSHLLIPRVGYSIMVPRPGMSAALEPFQAVLQLRGLEPTLSLLMLLRVVGKEAVGMALGSLEIGQDTNLCGDSRAWRFVCHSRWRYIQYDADWPALEAKAKQFRVREQEAGGARC